MESKTVYKGQYQELVDDFIDIGYMAENVHITDVHSQKNEIKRSNPDKSMSLFISFPNLDFKSELLAIDDFMSDIKVGIHCYFFFASMSDVLNDLQKDLKIFQIVYDSEDEFGEMYGTKIVQGSLEGLLTKALFLISKDGAVFYLEMPQNIEDFFNLEMLQAGLNKAYVTYNGVGCHG